MEVNGDYDRVEVIGLPNGLHFDEENLEVIGLPTEVGSFDLNFTAHNQAGFSQAFYPTVVEKTEPSISTVKPRNISSNGALATASIISNGGEAMTMSLFWGTMEAAIQAFGKTTRLLEGIFLKAGFLISSIT